MFSGGREKVHWEQMGEDRSRFSPARHFSSFRIPNMHIIFLWKILSELLSIFYGSHFKTAKTKTSVSIIMFPINCQMFIALYNIQGEKKWKWRRFGVVVGNSEHVGHVLLFLLLKLSSFWNVYWDTPQEVGILNEKRTDSRHPNSLFRV